MSEPNLRCSGPEPLELPAGVRGNGAEAGYAAGAKPVRHHLLVPVLGYSAQGLELGAFRVQDGDAALGQELAEQAALGRAIALHVAVIVQVVAGQAAEFGDERRALALRRDWCFALYPPDRLRALRDALAMPGLSSSP